MFSFMFWFFLTLTHIAVFDEYLSSSTVHQKENIYLCFSGMSWGKGKDLFVVCLTSVSSVRVYLAVFRVCGVGAERGLRRGLLRVCGRGMKNVYKPNHGYCHCSAFISSSLFLFHSNEALRNFSHNIEVQDDVLPHDTVVVVVLRCDFLPLNWRRAPCQLCPCFRYSKSRQDLHPCDSFLFWCWLYRICSAQVVD